METPIHHLCVNARPGLRLVIDDADRYALIDHVSAQLGPRLLSYCGMDTHFHGTVEGHPAASAERMDAGVRLYARAFHRRHGESRTLVLGPVHVYEALDGPEALARTIRYLHANPCKTEPPLVERARNYPWSSRRAFAGLTLARAANVERAIALLGPAARRVVGLCPGFADIQPVAAPTVSLGVLLAAAADTYGVAPWTLPGPSRDPRVRHARVLFVKLGQLEGYKLAPLGVAVGRSAAQACRLASSPLDVEDRALSIARTIARDPALRAHLPVRPVAPIPLATPAR